MKGFAITKYGKTLLRSIQFHPLDEIDVYQLLEMQNRALLALKVRKIVNFRSFQPSYSSQAILLVVSSAMNHEIWSCVSPMDKKHLLLFFIYKTIIEHTADIGQIKVRSENLPSLGKECSQITALTCWIPADKFYSYDLSDELKKFVRKIIQLGPLLIQYIKDAFQEIENLLKQAPLNYHKLICVGIHHILGWGQIREFFIESMSLFDPQAAFWTYTCDIIHRQILTEIGFELFEEKKIFDATFWVLVRNKR